MKVVMRVDVPKVGEAGSIQNVSDGFGRNYLLPRGLAVLATNGEVKTAQHNAAVKGRKVARQEATLQALADKIDGKRLEFQARVGDQGRLFGSVTASDIAEQLSKLVGEEIDHRKVVLGDHLKQAGDHDVTVHLVGKLKPRILVSVIGVDEHGNPIAAIAEELSDDSGDEVVDVVEIIETEAE